MGCGENVDKCRDENVDKEIRRKTDSLQVKDQCGYQHIFTKTNSAWYAQRQSRKKTSAGMTMSRKLPVRGSGTENEMKWKTRADAAMSFRKQEPRTCLTSVVLKP